MKVFVVATGLAGSMLLATGALVLWDIEDSGSKIIYETTDSSISPDIGSQLSSLPSTAAGGANSQTVDSILSSDLRNLTTEEIEEAITLLKQEQNLSEFELAMVTLALYRKHQDPEVAQVQSSALLMALDSAGLKDDGQLGDGIVFKDEQKKIIKEIMEMDSIPDGLTPQQYLQKRLQELKETTLAEGHLPAGDF